MFLRAKAFIEKISKGEINLPNTSWRDPPGTSKHDLLTVNGEHTSMTEVQSCLQDTIKQCGSDINKMLEGVDESKDTPLGEIHDRLGSTEVGYNALMDPRNTYGKRSGRVIIDRIVTEPKWAVTLLDGGSEPFHHGVRGDGKDLRWSMDRVLDLSLMIDNITRLLGIAIHLVYGSPARGSELLTAKIINCAEGIRGWYVISSRVVIVCRWQKSSSLEGGKDTVIPRVLDATVSRLFVRYLAYIHPVQIFLASVLNWSPSKVDNVRLFLYVQRGARIETNTLSDWLKLTGIGQAASKHGGLGVEDWRQLVSFVQDYFNIRLSFDGNGDDGAVSGFGHRGKVHSSWYNRDGDWIPGMEIRLMQRAMSSCSVWHGILGLSLDLPIGEDGDTIVSNRNDVPPESMSTGNHVFAPASIKTIIDLMEAPIRSAIEGAITAKDAHTTKDDPFSQRLLPLANIEVPAERVTQLRKLGYTWGFKSRTQAMVAEKMIANVQDGVYIMPTGSGKTLPYILTASVIGPHRFIAVCVPFRALLDELCRRINDSGVHAWEWKEKARENERTGICLISAERMAAWTSWAKGVVDQLVGHLPSRSLTISTVSSSRKLMR